ncbi:MAG: hypothetical protein FWE19_08005 [Oscillospiraceae bacterium]|nr:hypothetical protein [Oscillospiraceae bacterium]
MAHNLPEVAKMSPHHEMRSYYKRMLCMLKDIERESSSPTLTRYIRAIEVEMDVEDVAYVNEKMK